MAGADFCGVKAAFFLDKLSDLPKYNSQTNAKNSRLKWSVTMKNKN